HQCVTDGRNVVLLTIILNQHRLADEVTQRDPKSTREFRQDVESPDFPLPALDLAEPVLRASHEVRQHGLRQPAARPVERDALPEAEVVSRSTHEVNHRSEHPPSDPDILSGHLLTGWLLLVVVAVDTPDRRSVTCTQAMAAAAVISLRAPLSPATEVVRNSSWSGRRRCRAGSHCTVAVI